MTAPLLVHMSYCEREAVLTHRAQGQSRLILPQGFNTAPILTAQGSQSIPGSPPLRLIGVIPQLTDRRSCLTNVPFSITA